MNTQTAILVVKKEKEMLTNLIKDCWKYCNDEIKNNFKIIRNSNQIDYIEQANESFLKTWGEKLNLIGMENIIKFEMNSSWDMGYIIYNKQLNENENLERELNKRLLITKILTKENIERAKKEKWEKRQLRIEKLKRMGGVLISSDKRF